MRVRLLLVAIAVLIVVIGAAIAQRTTEDPEPGLLVAPVTPAPVVTATVGPSTPSPVATPTPEPTPEPTPQPTLVEVLTPEVGRGETLLVRASAEGATRGSVVARGEQFPLILEGETLFAVVGMPLDAALGAQEATLTLLDSAGAVVDEVSAAFTVVEVVRPVDFLELTEEEASVLTPEASALERRLRTEQFAEFDRTRSWGGLFRVPAEGIFTTEFGSGRSINGGPVGGFHTGTDIAAALGTPVIAAASGRVSWVGEMPIRGNTVLIDHGAGVITGYHHLEGTLVEVDQLVEAGIQIGTLGSTGLSTGPHLHWELTIYGVNVDAMEWTREDFTPPLFSLDESN